jgi:hypothetical protein
MRPVVVCGEQFTELVARFTVTSFHILHIAFRTVSGIRRCAQQRNGSNDLFDEIGRGFVSVVVNIYFLQIKELTN